MLAKWETRSQAEQQVQLNNTSVEPSEAWAVRRSRGGTDPCMFPCLDGHHCLYADSCNCSFYQATGSHCQTVPNTGLEREMTCRSWGQYNYETFDGLYYYFPGKCSYTLLKDCEDNTKSSVFIQLHNDPECNSNPYSCRRSVSLFLPWEGEIRLQGFNVTFKGQSLQLPHNFHNIELERISNYILVSQHQVFMLAWQGLSSSIYIKMSPEFVGRTCGLCGNFNADVQDDLKTSYGVFTDNLAMFGNSWMEEEPQKLTCPRVPSLYPFPCSAQEPHNLLKVEEVCTTLLKDPFTSCHEFVSPYSYMASCSNDLCMSGSSGDMVCQVFTEYTRACAHAGHPLHNWRAHFPQCGIECPAELLYRECITCCPVHCNIEHICIDSKLQCLDGCYCPDDLIYEDGICVKPSDCPCEHQGMLYPSGHTIQEECNNCTCVGDVWNCTEHSCPGECSVTGDMYFQSFDGRVYTFPATCQYVLAKSRSPGGFIVTIQNTPCGPNLDGACIQSVNLVLNEDPRTEVTLSHSGEVYMASQIRISLPYSDEMFQIQEVSSMFVQVKTVQGLRLQYNWKEFRLYLQLAELWRDDTVGLCGTFNGNIQDDFLAPSGMIESSPNLFGNAWRLSSACMPRPSLPQLDPCDTHQQAASFAVEKCDVLMQEVFAVCHEHVSPMAFQLQCHADVCRCGTQCLCAALAHYTRACRKHSIIIEFRSHVPECAVTCPPTMEYGVCVSSCERHCLSLSLTQFCGDECEEGCVCPQGTYYSTHTQTCVKRSECPCSFLGADYSPGDVILTSSDIQICQDGKIVSQSINTDTLCPPGQVYEDCGNVVEGLSSSKGLACVHTCESYLLNLTCSSHEPCVPGCICPPGFLKHGDECFEPIACPCLWKGKEYYPGDRVSSPCHHCVCQHGSFQCDFRPCASMCTVYGDRHYRTFDGLLFDYIGDCKVYLLKSSTDVTMSVTAENVDCFESGVICRKSILISIGQSIIVFDNEDGKPNPSSVIDRQNVYILNAGYFTIIHLTQHEISVLWDRKTTIHIQAGPRWQGKLSGLCGNFDLKTVNEMKTPDNMDLSTPQEFGNSWTAAECIKSADIRHPCTLNPIREPFAKRQCGILLSEVFQACHPVVDVTWYYMNCLADTCSCSRGGDCECFCTSLATYAHSCCQQGIPIDWRSPSLCSYDCEYYNKVLGKGPYRLLTYIEKNLLLAANRTSGLVFLKRGVSSTDGVVTLFMMTPGLSKTRPHDSSLVSFEAADRPNYFLLAERSGHVRLRKWEDSREFCDAATFILHRDTWITGFDSLESLMWPGFFLQYMLYKLQLLKYNHSARYRRATLFKLAGSTTDYSMSPQCQWRYESCTRPCFRTCSDPAALSCVTILKVEGCLPQCPAHMVMDEMTQRCVYLEDCIKPPVTLPEFNLTPTAVTSSTLATATVSTIAATEALSTTISHTKSSPPKLSSTAFTTFTTHSSTLLSIPNTTATIPVADESMKTSSYPPKSLFSTPRTITVPTTNVFTSNITRTMTTTVRATVTPTLSISTNSSVTSSMDMSPTSAKLLKKVATIVTPNIISAVAPTMHKTSRITMTTHIPPPIVTEKPTKITTTEKMLATTAKPVSQTISSPFTFSTIPSTKTPLQKTENRTAMDTTATSVSTSTSTTASRAPDYTTTASERTIFLTLSPSDWQLVDEMSSATHITERLTSPDMSQTSSPAVLITATTPYITKTKHWITPTEEFLTLTPTSAKDVSPSKVCTEPYSVVVDECTKLICVNGQLVLFNKSQICPYDSSPPNCGLLGFAVLINGDKCCPKWDCPCRCSVFPDINVVTFDGNSIALYKAAAYVVTQLMNETVTILVQECHSSDSTLVWNFTHLCLAALNITHDSNQVLIHRLQRQVYVNSRYAKPRLKKYGFEILDTGIMYLIWTPAGLKIQWFHSTGMMVIETETYANKVSTMGLCGCCDGNSLNDLLLPNGTVVADDEDPAVFIDSWQIPNTTSYVSQSRRREVNCSTSDCSDCLNMLNNFTFTVCHSYVPPATFCEIWVRDAEYVNNPCMALAAYVASCHKFNVCIKWRSPDYCPFVCPGTLQYQACLPACTAPSCPNKEFEYDTVQCSGMSEGCMCPEGTLLHRPYSALCISPVKCACTDSFGTPRALGEVWKASVDGCCMYRCESDGIVPVEFECSDVPQPVCTRAGEISISLADDNSCCTQRVCVCNQSACETTLMDCKFGQKLVSYFRHDSCCPEYTCECDPDQCVLDVPVCREDQTLIATRTEGSCCLAYICMCDICSEPIPECVDGEMLTVDTNSTDRCCPTYHCLCEPSRCSVITCPVGMVAVSTMVPEQCCPSQECRCACERISQPKCGLGENLQLDSAFMADPENHCGCRHYHCVRSAVCVDGKRGVMRPGQTLMEHSALGVCYTTRCTHRFDSATGFYLIKASSINCTAQCQPNQVYIPPKDQSACCGVCKNVSCVYHNDNGSLTLYKPGKSWVSDCMRYDCTDTQSGPVLVSYSYSCPPFNETECMKIGGTVMTYMDGCCKTCKEDGKSCQKVTVRMTIRKNDCRSNRPVNIVSCDGKCPSASIYNYNINTYARFCKCCREMGLQRRSVQLYCSGNSSWVNYSIQEPTDCSCQWS
ncbi:otogelin [Ictalurus furcatus]|uniref:otogelin n=1 Tax=Ictalurus furcatus TaxID=66913 RepID=UPI0023508EA9|nr:otogelin [Ictalurus furcatus]